MTTAPKTETESPLCPHCGAESTDDDDLCRCCGKVMVADVAQEEGCAHSLMAGLRSLRSKITPLPHNDFHYWDTLDLSDPSDPVIEITNYKSAAG